MIRTLVIALAVIAIAQGSNESSKKESAGSSESKSPEAKEIKAKVGEKVKLEWPKVSKAKKYEIKCKGKKTSLEESSHDNKQDLKFGHADTVICTVKALDKKGHEISTKEAIKFKIIVKEKDHHNSKSTCDFLPWVTQCEKGYDRNTAPNLIATGKATHVKIQIYIEAMRRVGKDLVWIDFRIGARWKDFRLKHHAGRTLYYNWNEQVQAIWQPDFYFMAASDITMPDALTPNQFLHIEEDGSVRKSSRVQLTLPCNGDICTLKIMSYGYPKKVMDYSWDDENSLLPTAQKLGVLGPILDKIQKKTCDASYHGVDYACLAAELTPK